MERVLVIGPGGAGKSTLARRLAEVTGLPVIHLDAYYWHAGWRPTPKDEWVEVVSSLLTGPRWIIDGNDSGTLDLRIAAVDTIVFLDWPRLRCIWGLVKRRPHYARRPAPTLPEGCPERLTVDFLKWVWSYPSRTRPRVLKLLTEVAAEKSVVTLRNRHQMADFIEGFRTIRPIL